MTEQGEAILYNLRSFYRSAALVGGYETGAFDGLEYAWKRGGWPAHIIGTPGKEGPGRIAAAVTEGKLPPFLIAADEAGLPVRELEQAGIRPVRQWTGMVLEQKDFKPSFPAEDIRLETVTPSMPEDWLKLVNTELLTSASMEKDWVINASKSDNYSLLVAHRDGHHAGAGMLFNSEGISGLYMVATGRDHRKKGVASVLCTRLVEEAWKLGSRTVVLHSTDMARNLYSGLGFRKVNRILVFWSLGVGA